MVAFEQSGVSNGKSDFFANWNNHFSDFCFDQATYHMFATHLILCGVKENYIDFNGDVYAIDCPMV